MIVNIAEYRTHPCSMSLSELFQSVRAGDEKAREVLMIRLDIYEAMLKLEEIEYADEP